MVISERSPEIDMYNRSRPLINYFTHMETRYPVQKNHHHIPINWHWTIAMHPAVFCGEHIDEKHHFLLQSHFLTWQHGEQDPNPWIHDWIFRIISFRSLHLTRIPKSRPLTAYVDKRPTYLSTDDECPHPFPRQETSNISAQLVGLSQSPNSKHT